MDKQILIDFENELKKYKVINFDKIWEKINSDYKLIYNIEGLSTDTKFYANIKLIFWLDSTKETLTDDVITYLYNLFCDYKSMPITTASETLQNIFKLLDDEQTNSEISEFIADGTDKFNEILKANDIPDFIQNIKFIPQGNMPCIDMQFKFELQTNGKTYEFYLKCFKDNWLLTYDTMSEKVKINEVPKKITQWIYAIK